MNRLNARKELTPEALAALEKTEVSRRQFIKGSGALLVGFSMAGLAAQLGIAPRSARAQNLAGPGSNQLDSWIAIGADGKVTAYAGKCELGQDRKSTRLNSSHIQKSRMPSSA